MISKDKWRKHKSVTHVVLGICQVVVGAVRGIERTCADAYAKGWPAFESTGGVGVARARLGAKRACRQASHGGKGRPNTVECKTDPMLDTFGKITTELGNDMTFSPFKITITTTASWLSESPAMT
jgi:hypothetical protein